MMDTADAPPAPPIDPGLYDRMKATLETAGPLPAVEALCRELERSGDYANLFFALLMKKRVELGVPPFPTGSSTELPPGTHEDYEEAIRHAGRHVGQALLHRGDIPKAWSYYRMLGEPGPVKDALTAYQPGPDADIYPVVEVAWQHAVHPEKGFDLILDRQGVCSAITMSHSSDMSSNPSLRDYCIKRLIRALHEQLLERLRSDLETRGIAAPADITIPRIIAGHPELFAEDVYHIDVSHLSSVVQMALHLTSGPELDLARELCLYGTKLAPNLRGDAEPPYEDTYADYKIYLDVLAGDNVDAGLAHFRAKCGPGIEDGNATPAEAFVNLLLKLDRISEAFAVAKEYLGDVEDRQLNCPGVSELARRVGDYRALAEAAKAKADPVNYLAGLIAART